MQQNPTPIGISYDYLLGYHSGQQLTRISNSLTEKEVKAIGLRRYRKTRVVVTVDCTGFIAGVVDGCRDELAGLAHPVLDEEEE